jgi:hypothetical protein
MAPPIPKGEPAAYVACRSLGHSWEQIPSTADAGRPHPNCVWLWLRCVRCGTERHDQVSLWDGGIAARAYAWPDGYKHGADEPQLRRDDWRWAYLRVTGITKSTKYQPAETTGPEQEEEAS